VVENVQACILEVANFYMQRPAVLGKPFALVKVVKIHLNDDGTQWGAWVHPWEISTQGEDVDYFRDPWHASSAYKAHQRYNPNKSIQEQSESWTYPLSVLNEFQATVPMNVKWNKPRYK
jgi:hypothetical protein